MTTQTSMTHVITPSWGSMKKTVAWTRSLCLGVMTVCESHFHGTFVEGQLRLTLLGGLHLSPQTQKIKKIKEKERGISVHAVLVAPSPTYYRSILLKNVLTECKETGTECGAVSQLRFAVYDKHCCWFQHCAHWHSQCMCSLSGLSICLFVHLLSSSNLFKISSFSEGFGLKDLWMVGYRGIFSSLSLKVISCLHWRLFAKLTLTEMHLRSKVICRRF